jgi:hypothetical protein
MLSSCIIPLLLAFPIAFLFDWMHYCCTQFTVFIIFVQQLRHSFSESARVRRCDFSDLASSQTVNDPVDCHTTSNDSLVPSSSYFQWILEERRIQGKYTTMYLELKIPFLDDRTRIQPALLRYVHKIEASY